MAQRTRRSLVVEEYKKPPVLKQFEIPALEDGELLVKVDASTINPSDCAFLAGIYMPRPLPTVAGLEGTGIVVEAKGQQNQSWVGKRVVFMTETGTWSDYTVTPIKQTFEISKQVPLSSAASGVINPLTAIGMIQNWRSVTGGKGGIIIAPGASSLAKMLGRLAITENVTLLHIVRKKQQVEDLQKNGAKHVILTEGKWQQELKQKIKQLGINVIYDSISGGPITQALLSSIHGETNYYFYGSLELSSIKIPSVFPFFQGLHIHGFHLKQWWASISSEMQQKVRNRYDSLLKKQLSTQTYKEIGLTEIEEGIKLSVTHSNQGKVLIRIA